MSRSIPIGPKTWQSTARTGFGSWISDITYLVVVGGFAYVAVILDAWSRRAAGSAISRSIDVPLTLAALNAAVEMRKPPRGCVHHSDRVVGADAADPYVRITFR
jgi:transposase InsO family protein